MDNAAQAPRDDAKREGWRRVIDRELIEWGLNPGRFGEEDIEPPSRRTIQWAIHLARSLGEAGIGPPSRVVPDAHGGIVFEHQDGETFETFRISPDGSVEFRTFQDTQLVHRQSWAVGNPDQYGCD